MSQQAMTATKAIMAAIGTTATAVATAVATASVLLEDGKLGAEEYSSMIAAITTLVFSIYAVWRVPNTPKPPAQGPDEYSSRWP